MNKKNTNEKIKKDSDYYQYLLDRSLVIRTNLHEYRRNPMKNAEYKIKQYSNQGTLWILDRIDDADEKNYTFLAGTNMHVLSYVKSFDLYESHSSPSDNLRKYWNGGFVNYKNNKDIDVINQTNKVDNGNYPTLVRTDSTHQANISLGRIIQTNVVDIPENNDDATGEYKVKYYSNDSINSNDYFSRIWYTPYFHTTGSKAYSSLYQDKYFHNDENGNSITTNGGTDFVITKIKIPKNEIKNYLPTLAEIIGTNEEKDWYLKLLDSNNNLAVSPNQTFYIGGYPSNYWSHTKSTGGIIETQNRTIEPIDNVSYWAKYDEKTNKERNKNQDIYKRYTNDFRNDYNQLEHGMNLNFTIQNSILNTFSDKSKYLTGGSSGSLTIDSRFNAIGINFAGILDNDDNDSRYQNFYTNTISLFNSKGDYTDWNGSIKDDIVKKLKSEKTKTILLNRENYNN